MQSRKRKTSSKGSRSRSSSQKGKNAKKEASLRFPIQEIHKLLEMKFPSGTVKDEAAIFLTGVLEYLAAEIIELSANVARSRSGKEGGDPKLHFDDMVHATETDPEFKELLEKVRKAKVEKRH